MGTCRAAPRSLSVSGRAAPSVDLRPLLFLPADIARAWALGAVLSAVVMAALWLRQRSTRNATAVDVAWAANLGLIAVVLALSAHDAPMARRAWVAGFVGLWSVRLSWHLFRHRLGRQGEDARYRSLRERWGSKQHALFFVFFQAQALLDAALALPFALALANPSPSLSIAEWIGGALVCAGWVGETIADRQLARFKADPTSRGRTCRVGLWRVSRHPNYFFEWVVWCGFAAFAWPAPYGALGLLAPAAMLFLILRVTGIPPTEAQALRSRGDDYRDYQRTTSAFVPWFTKKGDLTACGTNR